MVRGRSIFLVLVLALTSPSLASAQAMRVGSAQNMSFGDAAGMLALRECLSRNTDALSSQCRSDYLRAFDSIQKRIAARVTVANACTREIVKICNGSTRETSKSVPCLTTAHGVSRNCLQAIDDAGYR